MTWSVLSGTLVLALVCASFAIAGAALARTWQRDESPTEFALDTVLCATALAMCLVSTLVVLQLGSPRIVLLASLALGPIGWRLGGPAARAQLRLCTHAALRALARSPLLWIVAALGLFTVARGLAIPQLAWDGLTYHLTYAASWLKHGGVVRLEGGGCWETYETFPKGVEALWFLTMAPFGRDHLVNLTNVPLWIGLGLAVRASAQRLGASRHAQDLGVLVVLACPVFFSYVTPAYTEVAKGFAIAAAIAAGTRALERGDARPLVPMGIALGVGLAVKLEALSWLPLGFVAALGCARTAALPALRHASFGGLLGGLVAAPWYGRNLAICGNPIYPSGLPGFSDGARAGSLQAWWSMTETSVLSQGSWGRVIDYLLISPWGAKYPLGPFWIYPATALALPLLLLIARGDTRRRAFFMLLVALHLLVVYLITPYNGLYVDADTRFLGPPLVATLLGVIAALAQAPAWLARGLGGLALLNALAYLPFTPTFHDLHPRAPSMWLAACLLAALGCAVFAARAASTPDAPGPARVRVRRARIASALFVVGAWLALPASLLSREQHRFQAYRDGYDLHPVPGSSKIVWQYVANLPPSRIAFSVGGVDSTEAWFFYPLFGPDLRHTVTYIGIERDDRPACQRRGMIRDEPNAEAWLGRIALEHIDYVVLRDSPVENDWMHAHPERFWLRVDNEHMKLYQVVRPRH